VKSEEYSYGSSEKRGLLVQWHLMCYSCRFGDVLCARATGLVAPDVLGLQV
jgi:hypothetical protein